MEDYVVFEMVFKLVFAVLGLLGNTLVIYSVRTFAFLQTKTYAFVTSLAVADLLLTLGNPIDQVIELMDTRNMSEVGFNRWRVTCQVSKLITVTGVFGDLVGIFGIALERFIYITFPLQYDNLLTRGRVVAVLVTSWTSDVCFSVFGVVFSNVEIQRGETCEVRNVFSETQVNIGYVPCVVAVLIIVAVLYIRIGQIAYRASRDIKRVGTLAGDSTNQNGVQNQNHQSKSQKRITWVLSLVIGVFIVTYVPSMIVLSLAARLPASYSMGWILAVFIVVWNINTFSNPIIYAWKNKDFKKAFYILFKRKLPPELLEHTGTGTLPA